jgi:hypothetical protein
MSYNQPVHHHVVHLSYNPPRCHCAHCSVTRKQAEHLQQAAQHTRNNDTLVYSSTCTLTTIGTTAAWRLAEYIDTMTMHGRPPATTLRCSCMFQQHAAPLMPLFTPHRANTQGHMQTLCSRAVLDTALTATTCTHQHNTDATDQHQCASHYLPLSLLLLRLPAAALVTSASPAAAPATACSEPCLLALLRL